MMRMLVPLACLVLAAVLGGTAITLASRGHPVTLPLDDAYIYLQYARTALDGQAGAYAPGDPVSNGITSPLWFALLLAVGALQGVLPGVAADAAGGALVLCTLAVGLLLILAFRLARAHGASAAGAWATVAVCLLAPLWFFGSFNGMETGLYAAALLGGALAVSGGSLLWLGLLALVRPEGAVLAVLLLGAALVHGPRNKSVSLSRRHALALLVLAAAALTLWFPRLIAEAPGSAWEAKAMWTEPDPEVRSFYYPRLPYFALRTLWFGLSGARPQPPLDLGQAILQPGAWPEWIWLLFLGGGAVLCFAGRRGRVPLLLWAAVSLSSLAAVSWDAHLYRYLIPAYPLLAVAATAGWFGASWRRHGETDAADAAEGQEQHRSIPGSGSATALVRRLAGGAVLAAAAVAAVGPQDQATAVRRLYRGECERVESGQGQTGLWLRDNTPPDARVAVHDAGAIAFLSERAVVDMVGLVTPEFAGASRQGEGALWEALEAFPPERRPTYAAVIPAWMPYLSRTLFFDERLWSAGRTGSGRQPVGRNFEIWRLSWPGGNFGHVPRLHGAAGGERGWRTVDEVDVAHLPSERAHGYIDDGGRSATEVRDLGFAGGGRREHALEGGRRPLTAVRFSLKVNPDTPARLVLRSTSSVGTTLTVRVGEWSAPLTVPQGDGIYAEPSVRIPREALKPDADGRVPIAVEGAGYRAYHWWALQPS